MNAGNLLEIKESDIKGHYGFAKSLLEGFDYSPRFGKESVSAPAQERSPGIGGSSRRFRSTTPGMVTRSTARASGVHLIQTINAVDDDSLTSPTEAQVIHALRRSLATANAAADQFAEQTALGEMMKQNLAGQLPSSSQSEFGELLSAAALIALQVFANMTNFLLSRFENTEGKVEIGEVEEIVTDNVHNALSGALWELEQNILKHSVSEAELMATVLACTESLMAKLELRAANTPRLEAFVANSYRVEADDFEISGFRASSSQKSTKLTMSFKKPEEVIGNHIAKYQAMKLSKMVMAYDFERKLNPFAELGGFIFTFMGDGKPGTGKTTLIQMMAGIINNYCQVAKYPFVYQNLSTDSIDSYQGKSGQNAKAFIRAVIDPNIIGFGTIDDIDQLAGKRGDKGSSAGQQEITAVLMESFAGANTVVRGNCTFGMFSNYPENVDDALRQRAGARFLVDGPQTRDDYIDILSLLLGKNHDIPLGDHELYAAQELKRAVSESYERYSKPQEAGLLNVFDKVSKDIGDMDDIAKLGTYLKAIQEADERFTGRAIKNITDAVKTRAMDFELPDEWMEKPELFFEKTYDEKKAMISELAQPITLDMIIQEINRYADSEFRYADKSDEVAIENIVREMQRREIAMKRYEKGV